MEIKDNSVKFNKGRTVSMYNKGMGLSLSAFWKELRTSKNNKYLITYKEVRAGP